MGIDSRAGGVAAMAWITTIRNGKQVRYWVRGDVGCTHGLLGRQPAWAGAGLAQVGLVAGTPVDPVAAKELLYGRHPVTGQVLRRPKMVAHKDAKVDAAVFANALRDLAAGHGTDPVGWLRSQRSRDRWTRLANALERTKPDPLVPIKDLDRLAKDARLPLEDLYPGEVLAFARANRDKNQSAAVLGQGLTVNFPKSLSALAALAPPPMAAVIAQEMRQVAFEVVAAAELFAGYGLVGEQGNGHLAQRVQGLGLLAVVNPHAQARPSKGHPGDPSLHLHITLINAIPLPGGRWGAFGSSGQDLRRHIAVLGELAKARLRTRLHDRLGLTFERDRATGEWEVVGIPKALCALWSRRSRALRKAAGPGASAAKRRVVAARLAQRERGRRWDPVLLLDSWRREAELVVGDVDRMLADTATGIPSTLAVPPAATEVLARMRLPRRAAVRRKGVERREVLAAVIAAFPDSLRSLTHARQVCDQVMDTAFTALPGRSGTSWVDTERYRVPKALVATSRQPLGWNDPTAPAVPILDSTASRTREQDQPQQLLVQVPEPSLLLPQIRRPASAPRTDSGDHDQVELDLGLDPGASAGGAETPADPFGEQLTIDVADGPPVRERAHGVTADQDLAVQLAAAETALQHAEAEADDFDQATQLLLAALGDGRGEAVTALRRRRLCLATAAAMATHAHQLLDQAHEDRTEAAKVKARAAQLRELAGTLRMSKAGKLEAAGLIRKDQHGGDGGGTGQAISRREVLGYAKTLEASAVDLEASAASHVTEAPELLRRAEQQAATEHETVEAALLAEDFTDQQLRDQDAAALAADTASTTQQREPGVVQRRTAVDAARSAVAALRAERELRERMPADQRAREEEIRAEVQSKAREARQAAADRRAALRAQQERGQQSQNRGGGVR
ncbi:relaxase domain-containing protein [Streptacidiphilus sp. MAP5-52]|uniref:relaxase domain-containing protein n=1 Tax=Streptacidiphilus sp. MAP5-52 TaxID=3156267 RepID=UPI0035126A4A